MAQPPKSGWCKNCNLKRPVILHRKQKADGFFQFCWMCAVCNQIYQHEGRPWVARSKVEKHFTAAEIASLPVLPSDHKTSCVKCGTPAVQFHHWAPKAIFGKDEAEQWPGDYLCPACHKLWHDKVTPGLWKEPV